MNTHQTADFAHELQATCSDLLPACIVSSSWPTVPVPPSLTLAAFVTAGYVKDGPTLVYVAQEAHTLTITGGDGTYWVALGQDTWTTVASWTRTAGTHYLWRLSATRPPDVDGLLVFVQVTVSGGNITAVTPAPGVPLAEALRAQAGLGTLAQQDASAVAITGGIATGLAGLGVANQAGNNLIAFSSSLQASGGSNRWFLFTDGDAPSYLTGTVQLVKTLGIQQPPSASYGLGLTWNKSTQYGLVLTPVSTDTGTQAVLFKNLAGTDVGSIATTASATAYNTSSDRRLKTAITPLVDALATVLALAPVQFRWRATGEQGTGFVADEVSPLVPEAVTGEAEAVDAEGQIVPQGLDLSKLVPYLVGACQALSQQVQALQARVAVLEGA